MKKRSRFFKTTAATYMAASCCLFRWFKMPSSALDVAREVVRSHVATVPARALPALHRTMYRASPTPRAKTPDARGAGIDRQGREDTSSTQTAG